MFGPVSGGNVLSTDIGRDDITDQPVIAYTRWMSATDSDLWAWLFDDDSFGALTRNAMYSDLSDQWSATQCSLAFVGGGAGKWVLAYTREFASGLSAIAMHCHDSGDTSLNLSVSTINAPGGFRYRNVDVGGSAGPSILGDAALAVFERDPVTSFDNTQVYASLIDPVSCSHSTPFALAPSFVSDQEAPAVNQIAASRADGWFVVWQEYRNGLPTDWDVFGRRVDGNGNVSASAYQFADPVPSHNQQPKVEGRSGAYMVTVARWTPPAVFTKDPSRAGDRIDFEQVDWPSASGSPTPGRAARRAPAAAT